ncbi:unnamed protein product [Acanthoscelides obtectus]|uniref:Secreted protein n=1 Tax=Acanthoscelides obtectus TaxID=200917 RepID=A0A9P0PKX2_ACAOB|nr:unnamed protein product [Acanthoscelides obtectus]CAK1677714.1 hypothetical protein AOBTE_LOCUS31504 [Acanthoscelides obtectus]
MSQAILIFGAVALSVCPCRAGVIKDGVEFQSSIVICPKPSDPSTKGSNCEKELEPRRLTNGGKELKQQRQPITSRHRTQRARSLGAIERTYSYPESGFFLNPITCILIQDLSADGKGGTVSVLDGGLYSKRLTIKLRSLSGHGLHYKIQIYTL